MAKFRLDSAGIAAVLNSGPVAAAVESLGSAVSASVGTPTASGRPLPVHRRMRTASGGRLRGVRPAVDITIADPAGLAVEAKRGYLVNAAASVGLEVKGKGS
ncbi:hypothetical protein SEA_SNEK_11 [Arthrobacter phage Snek]|uniref:Uncharacterized protein n=1 Tax=Arthrobacter phage Tweety19 TaxID=2768133 RepID=A0A7G9W209_9CAUD|nr:neck protein [Arthrobacter phage Tweety19]QNO12672.1 hypothetical protein SEA_TWEETY19_11 [Arthrobacter phage Tweety19]